MSSYVLKNRSTLGYIGFECDADGHDVVYNNNLALKFDNREDALDFAFDEHGKNHNFKAVKLRERNVEPSGSRRHKGRTERVVQAATKLILNTLDNEGYAASELGVELVEAVLAYQKGLN